MSDKFKINQGNSPSLQSQSEPSKPSKQSKHPNRLRTVLTWIVVSVVTLGTIIGGMVFLDDRKYYFISLLMIAYAIVPFFIRFEKRKPQSREVVIIAVMVAIAVAGRAAFFMVPQFKPVVAIVIISGVCLGKESGFLIGAMTGFVSNFIFGQGPWTPWQMFCFGIIGFIAGMLFEKTLVMKTPRKRQIILCIYGGLAAFFIYGGIIDLWTILGMTPEPVLGTFILAYTVALPFNLIHAVATVFFLYFITNPMINKLERVKLKYGAFR
ncbi:MAG: ECF transporter S component [Peptostreptococcaceae bacterium]|nr:ECF transporter S component [Peptostreptococcaceae bacterium]